MKYVIGSGWWCDDSLSSNNRKSVGHEYIRSKAFHKLWYKSINNYTNPVKIIIIDSASPVKPDLNMEDNRMEFISLDHNAGHASNLKELHCGWSLSVILGMQYALLCDVDYFVYVEQDVLLKGKGIIEYCIKQMKTPYMFGPRGGTPQILQQSFFIINKDKIRGFIHNYLSLRENDNELSPEIKFAISTNKLLIKVWPLIKLLPKFTIIPIIETLKKYDVLPIGFGRTRPIQFENQYYYFQHGTMEDIQEYSKITHV